MKTDIQHAKLRVACMNEDVILIKRLVFEEGIKVDEFNGLAMSICAYHGKLKSMQMLLELGSSDSSPA